MVYRPRSIKRERRTAREMDLLRHAIVEVLRGYNPMTVRQCFYQLVSRGVIAKTETEYKTVVRLLVQMRRRQQVPFGWIADNTRLMRKPRSFDSIEDALEYTRQTYRRALWNDQDAYVEVWLEKDALGGVVYEETELWDVPLMITRGYSSVTFLHSAAEAIAAQTKPAFIYYLGDWDPSGRDIPRKVEAGLREFAPYAEITFTRIAVTEEQIHLWSLPTRPTKATDSRAKSFLGESVEVDAIDPLRLRQLVSDAIESHIDAGVLERTRRIESLERASFGLN